MTGTYADPGTSVRLAPQRAITAAAWFGVAIVLLYEALAAPARPTRAVVWGGLALAAYAFGFLCLVGLGQGVGASLSRWRFGPWILVWYGAAYGLATVTWSQPQTGTTVALIALSSVLRALWLVAAGMTAWMLGYCVGPGWLARRSAARGVAALGRRFAAEVRSPAAPWILYAIGSAARVASAATTGRFGFVGDTASAVSTATGYGQILNVLGFCAPFAVAAAAMQVFRERLTSARITLAVLFIAELAVGATSGDKVNFLNAVLAVSIPYSAARHRLPKTAMIATAVAFLVVVVPFTAAYRSVVHGGPAVLTSTQAVNAAPEVLRQTVTVHGIMTTVPHSVDYLLERIQEIDSPAIILQRTPDQIGFLSPVQLVEIPLTGFVPRAVWPGKPIQLPMYQVSQEYYEQPATVYTAASITPVGDLYRYGGWIPVIVGMFLLGCGVRLLDDVLDARANPHAILLLLLLFPSVVVAESGWVAILSGIPLTVLIWLLSVALTFRARRST